MKLSKLALNVAIAAALYACGSKKGGASAETTAPPSAGAAGSDTQSPPSPGGTASGTDGSQQEESPTLPLGIPLESTRCYLDGGLSAEFGLWTYARARWQFEAGGTAKLSFRAYLEESCRNQVAHENRTYEYEITMAGNRGFVLALRRRNAHHHDAPAEEAWLIAMPVNEGALLHLDGQKGGGLLTSAPTVADLEAFVQAAEIAGVLFKK